MGDVIRGNIVARHTPGGNVTIDTTHTAAGLIRTSGSRPHIEIEHADLGDAIAALRAILDPRSPESPLGLLAGQAFAATGRWRVYFNHHGAAGRPWCIAPDAGGWEIAVVSVGMSTLAETVYRPKPAPDDEDGRPSAWIVVEGYLTVHDSGHASIGAP